LCQIISVAVLLDGPSHTCMVCFREITYYDVKKGVNFTTNLEKQETDLTADMISRSH